VRLAAALEITNNSTKRTSVYQTLVLEELGYSSSIL
jgi:hypothetical protein